MNVTARIDGTAGGYFPKRHQVPRREIRGLMADFVLRGERVVLCSLLRIGSYLFCGVFNKIPTFLTRFPHVTMTCRNLSPPVELYLLFYIGGNETRTKSVQQRPIVVSSARSREGGDASRST